MRSGTSRPKRVQVDGVAFVWLYVVGSVVLWGPVAIVWTVVRGDRPEWAWVNARAADGPLPHRLPAGVQRGYERGDLNLGSPAGPGDRPPADLRVRRARAGRPTGCSGGRGRPGRDRGNPAHLARRATQTRLDAGWCHLGVTTGVAIAAYTLWDDHAVNALDVPPLPDLRARPAPPAPRPHPAARPSPRAPADRVARGPRR